MPQLSGRMVLPAACAAMISLCGALTALGHPQLRSAWNARYAAQSSSMANLTNDCNLCHASGGGQPWNAYGWSLHQQFLVNPDLDPEQALINIESLNSDNDPGGRTNIAEILASAQPGWTSGPNNTWYYDGATLPNQLPAQLNQGVYDPIVPCPADTNNDNLVNVTDLLAVIGAWGTCAGCPPTSCAADINDDCAINVTDLLAVIGAWGSCPP